MKIFIKMQKRKFILVYTIAISIIIAGTCSIVAYEWDFPGRLSCRFNKEIVLGEKGYIAEVLTQSAEVYSPESNDDRSMAQYSPLPQGTLDYCSKEEIDSSESDKKYRLLSSGKRLLSENPSSDTEEYLKIYYDALPAENKINVLGFCESDRHTRLYLETLWKAPFSVKLYPCEYYTPEKNEESYTLQNTLYEYIEIIFDYCVQIDGAYFPFENTLFSKCTVEKKENNCVLRLYLKEKGKFYGYGTEYDASGRLVFSFLNPPVLVESSDAEFLGNTVILLDPGHGGYAQGAVGSLNGNEYYEKDINLLLAKEIKKELSDTGAKVILTRDYDTYLSLEERCELARNLQPDLFLSLHRNFSEYDIANGYENYIFTPYSHKIADLFNESAERLFNTVRGTRYNKAMYVTRITECPAVLCEDGYMSDEKELYNMLDKEGITQLAQMYKEVIVEYFCNIA